MDLYTCIYYFALFFAPIIGYLLLFKSKEQPLRKGLPDWYYLIKFFVAIKKLRHLKKANNDEQNEKHNTYHLIQGIDQNGNYLIIKQTLRHQQRLAETTIQLKFNGKYYQLNNKTSQVTTTTTNYGEFKAAGLEIQILEPYRRLRLLYNGLLLNDEGNFEHFRLNFLWRCAAKPIFYPENASVALQADALARERWRDGNWIDLLPEENYCEQYGALSGRIIREIDTITLNLASYRKYLTKGDSYYAIERDWSIFAAGEDGAVFNLGVRCYSDGYCAHVKYGNAILNNGSVFSVDEHDLNLYNFSEVPQVFVLHFKVGKEIFKCVLHLNVAQSRSEWCSEECGWKIVRIPFECELNAQQAKGIVTLWQQWRGDGNKKLPPPLLADLDAKTCLIHFVKPLEDDYAKNLRFSGGKATSLALLSTFDSKNLFEIPPGFVIFVAAFKFQVNNNKKIADVLKTLENSQGDLEEKCKAAVEIISNTPIDESLTKTIIVELENVYNKFQNDNNQLKWSWAVRSSAIGEDSSDLSAAGQNATYLGCKTEHEILKAIAKCWASPFSYKSVQYRKQHGLAIDCDLAVIVQRMVDADSAGVLFTSDPTTGNPLRMVVTSNYGLGESVVSGITDPDTIVLERDVKNDDELRVFSKAVGKKERKIVLKSNGIENESVAKTESNTLSLTQSQVLLLGNAGVLIEKAFGCRLDIEWAFQENQLFILQARPITTLNSWDEFELLHEFDTAVLSEEDTFLTKANIGEVMPGALTVLSRTTTAYMVALAMEKSANIHLSRFSDRALSFHQHHAFIEFTNMFSKTYGEDDVVTNQSLDLSVFGHLVRTEEMASVVIRRYAKPNGFEKIKYLFDTLHMVWIADDCLAKAINANETIEIDIKSHDSAQIAHEKIRNYLEKTFFQLTLYHTITSRASVVYQFIALSILTRDQPILTPDHYHDISLLFASHENVVSAEIPKNLQRLAKAITTAGLSEQFLSQPSQDGIEFLQQHSPDIYQEFRAFLNKHGHRSLKEFELQANTWASDPWKLMDFVKHNVKTGNFGNDDTQTNFSVEETARNLKTPKNETTRRLLKFVMGKSRKAVARREATKCELIRSVDKLRKAYTILAEKLKIAGRLPSVDLIFHLSDYEIGEVIRGTNTVVLVKKSLLRRRFYTKWDGLKFPEISRGVPVALQDNNDNDNKTIIDKEVKGTPVCMGEIKGRACVINSVEDANQLQQGDILITYCTDTAWSLYFPMLAGIVTELGGLISHGAVIAREFCLPCIVGTGNATKIFKTGDIVHLSGTKGVLRLIK